MTPANSLIAKMAEGRRPGERFPRQTSPFTQALYGEFGIAAREEAFDLGFEKWNAKYPGGYVEGELERVG